MADTPPSNFDWLLGVAVYCVREFVAVVFYLYCFSRLGTFDFLNGALVTFVTLVVFGFPFLNPYLFTCMRLGPWGRISLGVAAQVVLFTAAQCLGAGTAAAVVSVANATNATDEPVDDSFAVFDEFLAVLALLVGLMHLMQCDVPFLMRLAEAPEASKHQAVPLAVITSTSLLVAGLTRAFPSAHQGLHVSVYWWVRGDHSAPWRVLGGVLGTAAALVYHHLTFAEKPVIPVDGLRERVVTRKPVYMDLRII